jgi:DNA repair exonuclease SbcCD ATPase subunit
VELVVKLANERLLVTNKSVSGTEQTVEVAHEALISNWSTLRNWVNEDREFLLWRERVDTLLAEWERVEGKEDALLRGSLLIEAQKWFDQRSEDLSDQERKFIAASRELRERLAREDKERQVRELESARKLAEARRRQRNFSIALVGLVLFVGLVASFAMWKWLDTQRILQNQYQVWKVQGVIRPEFGLDYKRVGIGAIGGLTISDGGAFAVLVPVPPHRVGGESFPRI